MPGKKSPVRHSKNVLVPRKARQRIDTAWVLLHSAKLLSETADALHAERKQEKLALGMKLNAVSQRKKAMRKISSARRILYGTNPALNRRKTNRRLGWEKRVLVNGIPNYIPRNFTRGFGGKRPYYPDKRLKERRKKKQKA